MPLSRRTLLKGAGWLVGLFSALGWWPSTASAQKHRDEADCEQPHPDIPLEFYWRAVHDIRTPCSLRWEAPSGRLLLSLVIKQYPQGDAFHPGQRILQIRSHLTPAASSRTFSSQDIFVLETSENRDAAIRALEDLQDKLSMSVGMRLLNEPPVLFQLGYSLAYALHYVTHITHPYIYPGLAITRQWFYSVDDLETLHAEHAARETHE